MKVPDCGGLTGLAKWEEDVALGTPEHNGVRRTRPVLEVCWCAYHGMRKIQLHSLNKMHDVHQSLLSNNHWRLTQYMVEQVRYTVPFCMEATLAGKCNVFDDGFCRLTQHQMNGITWWLPHLGGPDPWFSSFSLTDAILATWPWGSITAHYFSNVHVAAVLH